MNGHDDVNGHVNLCSAIALSRPRPRRYLLQRRRLDPIGLDTIRKSDCQCAVISSKGAPRECNYGKRRHRKRSNLQPTGRQPIVLATELRTLAIPRLISVDTNDR